MPSQAINAQTGMSLVEVLVALVIFSIGILGLAKLQISSIQANAQAMELTEAALVLSDQAERLLDRPWSKSEMDGDLASGAHSLSISGTPFSVSWSVTDGPSPLRQKSIALQVRWSEGAQTHRLTQNLVRNRR